MNIKSFIFILVFLFILMSCGGDSGSGGSGSSVKNPLLSQQWYYENTAQKSYAGKAGIAGKDINVKSVHQAGITGKNVSVIIVDDGLDMTHEDLNTSQTYSYDFVDSDTNPTPTAAIDSHGTGVAGIINMQDNYVGGLGIAPGAILYGRNWLQTQTTDQLYYSLGLKGSPSGSAQTFDYLHIFNNSWGGDHCSNVPFDDAAYNIFKTSYNGRNGYGYIYTKAAGNGFESYGGCDCSDANNIGVSCQNANSDELPVPMIIFIGASNADGKISSYSTHGANLWVAAPGGEYGYQDDRKLEYSGNIYNYLDEHYKPAMITTDLMGCSRGYSNSFYVSETDFNYNYNSGTAYNYVILESYSGYPSYMLYSRVGAHSDNGSCNYNSTMSGTSSAAPSTSGVIALMLEAQPALTWRDVKHILATTSDNSPILSDKKITVNSSDLTIDDGWVTNAAGYKFSNAYGFGIVDAKRAVDAASGYVLNSLGSYDTITGSNTTSVSITDNDIAGVTSTITGMASKVIENVIVKVNLTHLDVNNIMMVLISPQGTESIIYWPKNGFKGASDFSDYALNTNAFYGEDSVGSWSLKIIDVESGNTGSLTDWSIEINGH
jgi:subtilisin family serine protease